MKGYLTILILIFVITISCDSDNTDTKGLDENCSFQFEIDEASGSTFKYNSETGQLKKLINPFLDEPLYTDTVVFIPQKALCDLMTLCVKYKILEYPSEFKPESGIEVNPEPRYRLRFKIKDKVKEITWRTNTAIYESKEASDLNEIISTIDSLILSTPEFKALPEGQYKWL